MRVPALLTGAVRTAMWRRAKLIAALLVAVMAGTGIWLAGPPLADAADGDVTFNGRGFGHGRGMSQWGAYGYSVDLGLDYRTILNHYYGGTTLAGDAGNPAIKVELLSMVGKETVIWSPSGLNINGYNVGRQAIRIRGIGSHTFEVLVGDNCNGPWTPWGGPNGARVEGRANIVGVMQLCEANQVRAYRGNMIVLDGGGYQTTLNEVGLDDYLRGVLPREVPASWGSAGGGRGMEALKSQAVAARSYALSSTYVKNYADTCDTTQCQVYGGTYTQGFGAGLVSAEDSRTSAAVDQTSGQVRRKANGAVARAEFSASSGGWTAGGEFPAVEDRGDMTAANPNNGWSVTVARSTLAARLGNIPPITSMRITERSGLGPEGGRVVKVVFETTGGPRTFTGNQVRSALGLKSDWFTISSVSIVEARSFARALYVDVLGREGDGAGIEHWASTVASGADRRAVARGFAGSGERFGGWVNVAYARALHRSPDQAGGSYWWNQLNRGWTLNDLNAGIYGSWEAVQVLGGGDGRMWVEGLYQNLLGRSAGPEDRLYWATRAGREGFVAVAGAISTSGEARDRRLAEYYQVLLGRSMDEGGRSTFSPMLAGNGDVEAVAIIASSAEYWQRARARFP